MNFPLEACERLARPGPRRRGVVASGASPTTACARDKPGPCTPGSRSPARGAPRPTPSAPWGVHGMSRRGAGLGAAGVCSTPPGKTGAAQIMAPGACPAGDEGGWSCSQAGAAPSSREQGRGGCHRETPPSDTVVPVTQGRVCTKNRQKGRRGWVPNARERGGTGTPSSGAVSAVVMGMGNARRSAGEEGAGGWGAVHAGPGPGGGLWTQPPGE